MDLVTELEDRLHGHPCHFHTLAAHLESSTTHFGSLDPAMPAFQSASGRMLSKCLTVNAMEAIASDLNLPLAEENGVRWPQFAGHRRTLAHIHRGSCWPLFHCWLVGTAMVRSQTLVAILFRRVVLHVSHLPFPFLSKLSLVFFPCFPWLGSGEVGPTLDSMHCPTATPDSAKLLTSTQRRLGTQCPVRVIDEKIASHVSVRSDSAAVHLRGRLLPAPNLAPWSLSFLSSCLRRPLPLQVHSKFSFPFPADN